MPMKKFQDQFQFNVQSAKTSIDQFQQTLSGVTHFLKS